jgi:hypothetical protein
MAFDLSIERDTGALLFDSDIRIRAREAQSEVIDLLAQLVKEQRDLGNGYVWVDLHGLTFGDYPCAASLCFVMDRLYEVSWSVSLPEAEAENRWPMRKTIEAEIKFVRGILKRQLNRDFERGQEDFPWGTIWSVFDLKGNLASNGLRYAM